MHTCTHPFDPAASTGLVGGMGFRLMRKPIIFHDRFRFVTLVLLVSQTAAAAPLLPTIPTFVPGHVPQTPLYLTLH
jgi:hypothetical protein